MDPEIPGTPDAVPPTADAVPPAAPYAPPNAPQPDASPWSSPGPQAPPDGFPAQAPGYPPYPQQQDAPPFPPQQGYPGYPPPQYPPYAQQQYGYYGYGYGYGPAYGQQPGTNGLAVAAMVMGIVGFFWITPILGLIFGFVALSQCKRTGQQGRGMAIAGIILSSLWIALFATIIAVGIANSNSDGGTPAHTGGSTVYGMNLSTNPRQASNM